MIDEASASTVNEARKLGLLSHDLYVRVTPPGQPASTEILGVETWYDGEGMEKWYSQGEEAMAGIFTGVPDATVWKQPAGSWIEW